MSRYCFHLLDPEGAVALSQTVACADDLDALAQGVRRSDQWAIEIWLRERLVARIKLGNAPLDVRDLHSL